MPNVDFYADAYLPKSVSTWGVEKELPWLVLQVYSSRVKYSSCPKVCLSVCLSSTFWPV